MAEKLTSSSVVSGRWRITSMGNWDQSYVDREVKAYIKFELNEMGHFKFYYVSSDIDYRLCTRDGRPAVEWSWYGTDHMEPAFGRGYAMLINNELQGRFFFHNGDDSGFVASKSR